CSPVSFCARRTQSRNTVSAFPFAAMGYAHTFRLALSTMPLSHITPATLGEECPVR
ncbi:unnamed protein product, partial [Tilletia caries]